MSEDSPDELQTEYCERLTSALIYMAARLKPLTEDILKKRYKGAWQDNIAYIADHPPKLEDPYILLATIRSHWDTFRGELTVNESDIELLWKARNEAVHYNGPKKLDSENG